jgi:hypothetical protein
VIESFVSCGVLLALLWIFERERRLEVSEVAGIIIAPILFAAIVGLTGLFLSAKIVVPLRVTVFAGVTFYILYSIFRFPVKRAVAYTAAVLITNVTTSVLVFVLIK